MAKLLDIGKSILRAYAQSGKPLAEGNKAHDALQWLKKAFQVIEPLDCSATPELLELKVRLPRYASIKGRSMMKHICPAIRSQELG